MSKSFDAITLQASTDASITTDEQIGARHGDGAMRGMAPHRLGVSLLLILLPRLAVPLLKVLPAGAVFDSSKEEADGHHCVLPTRCASARHGRTGCRAELAAALREWIGKGLGSCTVGGFLHVQLRGGRALA